MTRPIIALDCDGVLLDYHLAYARAWQRAFGVFPCERDAKAYWPWDRWKVQRLNGKPLLRLRGHFNEHFWSTMPAMPDALAACHLLVDAGYQLHCVTAIQPQFEGARSLNLKRLGFPITKVSATPVQQAGSNPKAEVINRLRPLAFVDDYAPYLSSVDPGIHCALIERGLHGSPNQDYDFGPVMPSKHFNLMAFAQWWLGRKRL